MVFKQSFFEDPRFTLCTVISLDNTKSKTYYIRLIQQYYDPNTKHTWWGPADNKIVQSIVHNELLRSLFMRFSTSVIDGNNVVTVRQACRYMGITLPKKELWETRF